MKRLIPLAALASLWAGAASTAQAGSFGLTYSRQCSSCSFCVRPYNAFSSVTCGVASLGSCGPHGHKGFGQYGPYGHGHKVGFCPFSKYQVGPGGEGFVDDGCDGAFVSGGEVPFFGVPSIRGGYNPGCHMAWAWGNGSVPVPGHTPPPGPPPSPSTYHPQLVWLPPQPFPGMYNTVPPAPPMGGAGTPCAMAPAQYGQPNPAGFTPASYQQAYPNYQPGYQPATWWHPAYQGMQPYQGWYYHPGYGYPQATGR
jgi:hypothetical protein